MITIHTNSIYCAIQIHMKEIIKKILIEWQESKIPEIVERDYSFDKDFSQILAIIWPRRAGKTFFMYQIISWLLKKVAKNNILFVNFEDYRLIDLQTNDLGLLIDAHYELYGKKPTYLFFDEIQNLKNYGKILRTFKDGGYKIVVSGSSSKLLLEEVSTELRWRYHHLLILPFSFEEVIKYHHIETKNIEYSIKKWDIMNILQDYVEYWGFGELLVQEKNEKVKTIENYYKTIFYKDILERYSIKSKFLFEYFMKYIVNSYATIFSLGKFYEYLQSQKIEWSKKTLGNYLNYLQDAFFVIGVSKFSFSPKKSILSPKKIYLSDNSFINLATNYSENRGKKLENLIAIHLYKQEKKIYYFQKGKECDFIVKTWTKINQAIQVCRELNFENKERETKWLLEAMKTFNLTTGYIITYDQQEEIVIDDCKIQVIPIWKALIEKTI